MALRTSEPNRIEDLMTLSFGPSATGSSTVKPRPEAGPPSAWMSMATLAWEWLRICARLFTHGPTPLLLYLVITTFAPYLIRSARRYLATFQLNWASV